MNNGIKKNIPLFWKLLHNKIISSQKMNLINKNPYSKRHNSWSQEFNVRAAPTYENHQVLMRKGKFIKFWLNTFSPARFASGKCIH